MRSKPLHAVSAAAALLAGTAVLASGCAAVKATQQPTKRNMSVLDFGVPRTHVVAEFGTPVLSEQRASGAVDVFAFKQGYSKTTKSLRALVHVAADVMTLGLWEMVGIPAEIMINGTEVQVEVHYDSRQNVERVVVIKGEKAVNPPPLFASKQRRHKRSSQDSTRVPDTNAAAGDEPEAIAKESTTLR